MTAARSVAAAQRTTTLSAGGAVRVCLALNAVVRSRVANGGSCTAGAGCVRAIRIGETLHAPVIVHVTVSRHTRRAGGVIYALHTGVVRRARAVCAEAISVYDTLNAIPGLNVTRRRCARTGRSIHALASRHTPVGCHVACLV
jgi:hypothetical protein